MLFQYCELMFILLPKEAASLMLFMKKKILKRDDSPIEREANDFQKVELQ